METQRKEIAINLIKEGNLKRLVLIKLDAFFITSLPLHTANLHRDVPKTLDF